MTTLAWRPALTAGTALTTTLPTLPTLATSTRRTNLFRRQLAITIFVERLERSGGIGDFLRVEFAVVVRIKRGHQWSTHHALPTLSALSTRTALTALTGTARTALPVLARRMSATGDLRLILRQRERGRNAQRERGEQDCL